ncbi:hypothetical protein F8154_11390 [Alkaliphilus pronyensis]|uniref:Uncharacterized protein n=1 Tax=Alkaliphilus pronyensis TaxID=1482732 RepID=A0A6I0EZN1_9FIRM|nr:DUF6512 family protein [Alkaliphilus pronyensis]KAB3532744.1 hypothetical protein F8154_11390 [Alkaliphilus pronyensis]
MSKLIFWELVGVFIIFVLGTIFHFAYDWLGNIKALGFIFPVNESVWEHLKMVFGPFIIFSVFEYCFINKSFNKMIVAKTLAIFSACIAIILLHNGYRLILGHHVVIIDIVIFLLSIVFGQFLSYKILSGSHPRMFTIDLSYLCIFLLFVAFIFLTYNPPNIFLFK